MGLNRRTFLQQAGLALTALGVSETVLSLLGDKSLAMPLLDRYFQALAQPGGRKLALLVGINQYPRSTALSGCVTDVELQRELLIHRFGFNASDVLTLTDSQATRENIETAFIEHLTEQAKAGDVVVFHFSGYGSQVKLSEEYQIDNAVRLSNSLVPVDSILPTKGTPTANDLLEETLVLLLRSLATDHITTVLDTSYTNAGNVLQGNLRVRSCPKPPAESPNPGELAFQEQLLLRLKSSRELLKNQASPNQTPGIVLAAAEPSQAAKEALWNGFSAGLFTYALTQHLWQASPATTVQISLSRAAGTLKQLAGIEQQPRLIAQKSLNQPLLAYYLPPDPSLGAEGVVTAVEDNGKNVHLWLAGLPATVLEYYGSSSVLTLSSSKTASSLPRSDSKGEGEQGKEDGETPRQGDAGTVKEITALPHPPQLQMRSKEGLTARARIVGIGLSDNYPLQVGQLVREAIRVLPRNLGLAIALDVHLERIERVDATSAFATIPGVSSVVVAGEQPADYLFGKVRETQPAVPVTTDSASDSAVRLESNGFSTRTGGYGLFYLASEPIRNTVGEAGEAVRSAINRLTPKLKTLLAAKLLRLTANEGSSRLGIRVSLERVAPDQAVVMQRETLRASSFSQAVADKKTTRDVMPNVGEGSLPTLAVGSRIQYRLENYSDRPIYFMLLGFDTSGNAIALYKIPSSQEAQGADNKPPLLDGLIAPGQTLTLPQSLVATDWVIPAPGGLAEIQLICSRAPFTKAIAALEAARRPKGEGEQIGDLFNPLEVAQAVLQDLHAASAISMANSSSYALDSTSTVADSYALDVNAWATLSFIYQVI